MAEKIYLPTQAKIREICEEIRSKESPEQLEKRAKRSGSYATLPWVLPLVSTKADCWVDER